ncbi:glutamyl-tRNA synthetase [Xanthobacter versatilis]|uniref:Glutamate--tRNA ligase 1 n=1 Tax=Xanthobacter autotrophicus (strain ATCC BAA-1158 / Py2) TaxID=78245 RepID=SYE1_XANP2|nr:RecName: Full=Glutamate--tRNA ligase 1; AltName: Full=Glutamyl-tRNA synthetase 1; Short=GluRS 1 [Xanthobacter autotrophicus Py2]ABS69590.1 glutamyl-tRNA synthetase [Xanthobacter autotrophicus Py2]
MSQIVTRFAPSPTGFLHIGGARTALFNWLYARHTGGKMLLRIEDTDRQRSTKEAIAAIIEGLEWLGITCDGDPIYQFARAERHRAAVEEMLAKGNAYRCYATPQELDEMRELARKEGRPPRYDGRWRDRDPSEAPKDRDPVIRLRAPQEGETVIDDMVQGTVTFPNKDLDDLVLLRSDGNPTYMLAVVVDDHDMGVTHVIRGDDHLTNAARQTQIYRALGWEVPRMAHIPLIHGPDGAKLSKRHGALGVDAYRDMGYLPAALRNYLVRLGWSHGDQEVFSTEEMVSFFDLDKVGRSAARFDFQKLESLNGHYMRASSDAELLSAIDALVPHLPDAEHRLARMTPERRAQLAAAMPGLKERAKTLVELVDNAEFIFVERPLPLDDKAAALLSPEARAHLARLVPALEQVEWTAAATEAAVRAYAEAQGVKLGAVAQPLRAALTGKPTSPPIFDVLMVLGRDESLARLKDQAA